jgi:hypothetical protein
MMSLLIHEPNADSKQTEVISMLSFIVLLIYGIVLFLSIAQLSNALLAGGDKKEGFSCVQ